VEFTKVAMNPGMPQGHGIVGDERVPIITLPGNPVSSYISFENFVRPVIRAMRGMSELTRPEITAVCAEAVDSPFGKRQFVRARFVAPGTVAPTGTGQGSHVMGGLAAAEAFIVIPEHVTRVEAGQEVVAVDLR
jgi:molybdopterin molybdotransferase